MSTVGGHKSTKTKEYAFFFVSRYNLTKLNADNRRPETKSHSGNDNNFGNKLRGEKTITEIINNKKLNKLKTIGIRIHNRHLT